jgi:hypothetical protein
MVSSKIVDSELSRSAKIKIYIWKVVLGFWEVSDFFGREPECFSGSCGGAHLPCIVHMELKGAP